jgi:hypothetical protein
MWIKRHLLAQAWFSPITVPSPLEHLSMMRPAPRAASWLWEISATMNTKGWCKREQNLPSCCCEIALGGGTHILAVDDGISTLLEDSSGHRTLTCLASKGSKFSYTSCCIGSLYASTMRQLCFHEVTYVSSLPDAEVIVSAVYSTFLEDVGGDLRLRLERCRCSCRE